MSRELREAEKLLDAKFRPKVAAAGQSPTLSIRLGTEIEMQAPRFFWDERMPIGEINLVEGDQMTGKSTMVLSLAARITKGEPMPFDGTPRKPQTVIWFSPEEDTGKAGLPRFIAAGGDPARFIEIRRNPHSRAPQMVFPAGAGLLDATLTDLKQKGHVIGLLAIDGLSVILEDGKSENSNNDVKGALEALLGVARKHDLPVIGLRHLGKSKDASPIHRGVGSIAFGAMSRSQWAVVPHPDFPERRLLAPLKWSYSKRTPRSMAFELASRDVTMANGSPRSFGVTEWIDECDISAREAFDAASKAAKGRAAPKQVSEAASAIKAAFAELEAGHDGAEEFLLPESVLKDAIVNGYKIPASAYFEAKKVLTQAKEFGSKKVGSEWCIRRWRTQYVRTVKRGEGE